MENSKQLQASGGKATLLFTGLMIRCYMAVSLVWVWVEQISKDKKDDRPGNNRGTAQKTSAGAGSTLSNG